jgi:hypothetical protein
MRDLSDEVDVVSMRRVVVERRRLSAWDGRWVERSVVKVAIEVSAGTGSDSVRGSDSPAKDETKTLIVSMLRYSIWCGREGRW